MTGPSGRRRLTPGQWFVVGQFTLLLGVSVAPGSPRPQSRTMKVPGAALLTAGALLAGWGLRSLGRNLTALPEPVEHAELVETGVYRWVRHPIYGGLLLLAAGWSLRRGSPAGLSLTAALLGLLQAKARYEEQALSARFPGYPEYARRVRRFLPGVY